MKVLPELFMIEPNTVAQAPGVGAKYHWNQRKNSYQLYGHVVVGNNYHSQLRNHSQGSFTLTFERYLSQPFYHSTSFEGLASSPYLFSVKIVAVRKFFPFPANP